MTFESLHPAEQAGLRKYCEWLNLWFASESQDPISIDNFFEYHETHRIVNASVGWYDLWILSAGYGDDGGPAVLYIWTDKDAHEPRYIVQEFDTMVQLILEAGEWLNIP